MKNPPLGGFYKTKKATIRCAKTPMAENASSSYRPAQRIKMTAIAKV